MNKEQLEYEAKSLAELDPISRALNRRSDGRYLDTLHNNTYIASRAGLRNIAKQKQECYTDRSAYTKALWNRVDEILKNQ